MKSSYDYAVHNHKTSDRKVISDAWRDAQLDEKRWEEKTTTRDSILKRFKLCFIKNAKVRFQ